MSSSSNENKPLLSPSVRQFCGVLVALLLLCFSISFHGADFYSRLFIHKSDEVKDFIQEWLSARCYWNGVSIYTPLRVALEANESNAPIGPWTSTLEYNAHPPASVLIALPFAYLPYRDAFIVWNVLNIPLLLGSLWLIARELKFHQNAIFGILGLALLLPYYPLHAQVYQGQLNILLLALLTVAWAATRHNKSTLAGGAIGVAAALKLFPALMFVYFAYTRRWRAFFAGIAAFIGLNGIALLLFGPAAFETFMKIVIPGGKHFQSNWENISWIGFWLRLFDPHPSQNIAPWIASPMLANVMIWLGRIVIFGTWLRSLRTRDIDKSFASGILAMLLLTPVTWSHSFVLFLLPLALMAARLPSYTSRFALVMVAALLWSPNGRPGQLLLGYPRFFELVASSAEPMQPSEMLILSIWNVLLVLLYALALFMKPREQNPDASCSR